MVLFLASWAMLFAALFFAYAALRARSPVWPPSGWRLPLGLPALNTAILLASSATLAWGLREARAGRLARLAPWIGATLLLGTAFLGLQIVVWRSVWQSGLHVDTSLYGSVFYALTVFHALHVVAGLGVLGWLLAGARRGAFAAARTAPIRLGAMFWHFVDAVWLILFFAVYVI
jgi:heme/copper-type cytochrome/quinol oxidase subunit 3